MLIMVASYSWLGWAQDSPPGPTGTTACAPATVYVNEPVNCSYTESDPDTTNGDGTPNGYPGPSFTVSFSPDHAGTFSPSNSCTAPTTLIDNNTPPDGVNDTWSGGCSVTYTPLEAGTHVITATGANDSDFDSIGVQARGVSVALSCTPDPVIVGNSVTCTITVTDITTQGSPLAPDGTIALSSDLQGPLGSCPLPTPLGNTNGSSVASCDVTFTPTVKGTHTLTASYTEDPGDGRQHNDGSGSGSLTVQGLPTTTTLSCTPDYPPNYIDTNDAEPCTVEVVGDTTGGPPTGTVTFSVLVGSGTFTPASCSLSPSGPDRSSCSVSYQAAAGSDGVHTLQASYSGNSTYDPSAGTLDLQVDGTSPTVSVTAPPAGTYHKPGDVVTITATIVDPSVGGVSSGVNSALVTADLSQLTGNPVDVAVPPDSIVGSTYTWTVTIGPVPDGTKTFTISAPDNVENLGVGSSTISVDGTPPTISHTVGSPKYPTGCADHPDCFITSSTQITVSVSDAGSGVSNCTIAVSGPAGTAYPACTTGTNAFNLAALFGAPPDGVYTVDVEAQDNVGNTNTYSFDVYLDDTPPGNYGETLGTPNYTFGGTTYVKSTTPIAVTADDGAGSGVQGCTLSLDGGPANPYVLGTNFFLPTPDGFHSYTVSCADNLGNASTFGPVERAVDDTPPAASFVLISGPNYGICPGPSCYVTSSTALRVDVADPLSGGVASGLNTCSISVSGPTPGSAPCNVTFSISGGDGLYTLTVEAQDHLGNALMTSFQLNLDNTPPDLQGPFHNNTTCWPACGVGDLVIPNRYVKALDQAAPPVPKSEFYYTITDTGSGLQSCSLTGQTVPTGAYTSGDVFTMQPGDGPKPIHLQCQDNLGNISTHSVNVIVDDTPPQFSKAVGSPNWPLGCQGDPAPDCYVRGDTPLQVGVSDPPAGSESGSGVRSGSCRLTGAVDFGTGTPPAPATFCPPNPYSFTLGLAGDDRYRFDVYAEDNLGNAATAADFLVVVLDNTPPQIDDPVHTNTTCYPFDRCDAVPEVVIDGTWVKARDKLPFYPSNPLLPAYPQFIPKSTFEYPNVYDPTVSPPGGEPPGGLDGSGLRGCTLSGGTTQDGFHLGPSIAGVDFSFLPGDGSRTFTLTCEDNLGNSSSQGRTLNVDDTPPEATFTTAGPLCTVDGVLFLESNTLVTPRLNDGIGVGVDLDGVGGPPADGGPTNPPCLQNQDQNGVLTQRCTTPFTFPPPDRDHHLWIVRPDLLGNVAESHFVFVVDDTPPRVELITPQDQAQYVLNGTVLADWRVTDDVSFFESGVEPPLAPGVTPRGSGVVEVIATTPKGEPLDTGSVGAKPFVLLARDCLGHQTVVQVTYHVVYDFEVDPALREAWARGEHRAGGVVPLSFWLGDARGAPVPDAQPQIRLFTDQGEEIPLHANGEPVFARYDPELERYVFELDTGALGLEPGRYELWVQPGDATTHKLKLTLR